MTFVKINVVLGREDGQFSYNILLLDKLASFFLPVILYIFRYVFLYAFSELSDYSCFTLCSWTRSFLRASFSLSVIGEPISTHPHYFHHYSNCKSWFSISPFMMKQNCLYQFSYMFFKCVWRLCTTMRFNTLLMVLVFLCVYGYRRFLFSIVSGSLYVSVVSNREFKRSH